MKPTRGRKSLRDILLENQAANKFYQAMLGGETPPQVIKIPDAPKKRILRENPIGEQDYSESGVLKEISELLAKHPKVLIAVRQNSGATSYENTAGKTIPLWFYRWIRRPEDMTIVDFWGFTTDFKPFAIEAKNRKWKKCSDKRELNQLAYIKQIISFGGRAGFATCLEDAISILKED